MLLALFAGIYVSDYQAATQWYARLLGGQPSFIPNDTEAVWELAERRSVYINVQPENAGHSVVTIFVDNLDERVAAIAAIAKRGIEPAKQETYGNGVRKVLYATPTGTRSASAERPLSRDAPGRQDAVERPSRSRSPPGPMLRDRHEPARKPAGHFHRKGITTVRLQSGRPAWQLRSRPERRDVRGIGPRACYAW